MPKQRLVIASAVRPRRAAFLARASSHMKARTAPRSLAFALAAFLATAAGCSLHGIFGGGICMLSPKWRTGVGPHCEHRHLRDSRRRLFEQLQHLAYDFGAGVKGEARNVAARPGQTGTNPRCSGLPTAAITIGMVFVAVLAASAASFDAVTITFICSPTRSAASNGRVR